MRLKVTISRRAPPHQARPDSGGASRTVTIDDVEAPGELALALIDARHTKLFEANGCLTLTFQADRADGTSAP